VLGLCVNDLEMASETVLEYVVGGHGDELASCLAPLIISTTSFTPPTKRVPFKALIDVTHSATHWSSKGFECRSRLADIQDARTGNRDLALIVSLGIALVKYRDRPEASRFDDNSERSPSPDLIESPAAKGLRATRRISSGMRAGGVTRIRSKTSTF